MNAITEVDRTPRTAMLYPNNVLYQISEDLLDKLIIKAEAKGFEHGQAKPLERPLTKKEAASYMRLHIKVFNKRFKDGVLPATLRHYNGGTIYFFASELEDFIKKS